MTPFIAEIVGTFLLILLGCGTNANILLKDTKGNRGESSGWMLITTGWGLAVYVAVVVAGPYSGAHINPAVTIGLAVAGEFPLKDIPMYLLGQMLGAMLGAFMVWAMYKDHYDREENAGLKRGTFCTDPAIPHTFRNVLGEVLGTFVLLFTILYFTDARLSDSDTLVGLGSLGALPVALLVWVIGIALGGTTGYAINPARDLGPRIVHALIPMRNKADSNWGYAWIPIVGPLAGCVLAAWAAALLG